MDGTDKFPYRDEIDKDDLKDIIVGGDIIKSSIFTTTDCRRYVRVNTLVDFNNLHLRLDANKCPLLPIKKYPDQAPNSPSLQKGKLATTWAELKRQ